jgi:hypothetical protein
MKRWILASVCMLAFCVPAVASATTSAKGHASRYEQLYHAVAAKLGSRAPGRNIVKWGYGAHHSHATKAQVSASIVVMQRMLHPPAVIVQSAHPAAPASSYAAPSEPYASSGGYADVPGVPASFAACVAMRESSDGAGSSNIYGILGGGGSGSLTSQKAAFSQMYAARGTQPWAPYDGC